MLLQTTNMLEYLTCNTAICRADQDKATRLQSILEYSQEVTAVLQAACSRYNALLAFLASCFLFKPSGDIVQTLAQLDLCF